MTQGVLPALLSIDFGSFHTKVAYRDDLTLALRVMSWSSKGSQSLPSLFYLSKEKHGPILTGYEATAMLEIDAAGVVGGVKRDIQRPGAIRCGTGRPSIERWELVALLYERIRMRCEKELFKGRGLTTCALTTPVWFNETQRERLRQAAEKAGFKTVRLIEEPVAAALGWAATQKGTLPGHLVVGDIGAGAAAWTALKRVENRYELMSELPAGTLLLDEREGDLALREKLIHLLPGVASKFVADFAEITADQDCPILLTGGCASLPGLREALENVVGLSSLRLNVLDDAATIFVKGGLSERHTIHENPPITDGGCIVCGRGNDPDSEFCEVCGASLFRDCPECETLIRVTAAFCQGCGTPAALFARLKECLALVTSLTEKGEYLHARDVADEVASDSEALTGEKGVALRSALDKARTLANGRLK